MRLQGDEDERARRITSIRDKLKKSVPVVEDERKRVGTTYDLSTEKAIVSDYLPAEPAKFKKRRKKKKKDGMKKTKSTIDEEDRVDASFMEDAQDDVSHKEDHGSRQAGNHMAQAEREREEKKKALKDSSYLRALSKAEQSSKRLLEDLENVFEDEHDEELQSSLDRARRLTRERKEKSKKKAAKRAQDEEEDDEDDSRAKALAEKVKGISDAKDNAMEEDDDNFVSLTATTEFCRGLQAKAEEAKAAKEAEEAREKKTKTKVVESVKPKKDGGIEENEDRDSDNEDMDEDDDEYNSDDEDQDKRDQIMNEEPLVAAGVSQALALAKIRGLLKEELTQAGRAKDGWIQFVYIDV